MAENQPNPTPLQEQRQKLKDIRATYTRAKKLLAEVERSHATFTRLKTALTDETNGVETNLAWLKARREEMQTVLTSAGTKLTELEAAADSVTTAVSKVNEDYARFNALSLQVFDANDGLDAVLKATRKLRASTLKLSEKISDDAKDSATKLSDITATTKQVSDAFDEFLIKKQQVDDEENGLEAQLRRATSYADSAQEAKTKSENALVSVTKFKDTSEELVTAIKDSKTAVDTYQTESKTLTDDIRNTLNLANQFTLSNALQQRTKSFNRQMFFWALLQTVAVVGLSIAVYRIFDVLFLQDTGTAVEQLKRLEEGPTLVSVISKFLFTTPLIFAVYYTTSNYRHARDLRDKYAWKETVAKNFQNYIKLLKDEFKGEAYERERFEFSMETIRSIYKEPYGGPRKKKYNLSLYNRIVQVNIEEEDLKELKSSVAEKIGSQDQPKGDDKPSTDSEAKTDAVEGVTTAVREAVQPVTKRVRVKLKDTETKPEA